MTPVVGCKRFDTSVVVDGPIPIKNLMYSAPYTVISALVANQLGSKSLPETLIYIRSKVS